MAWPYGASLNFFLRTCIIPNVETPWIPWKENRGDARHNMNLKLDLVINHKQQEKSEVEMTLRF